jgi:hypothetical protein
VTENAWTTAELDVASFADGRPEFWVRWGYGLDHALPFAGSGWNVDDVRLRGLAASSRMTLHVEGDVVTWQPVIGAVGTDLVRGLVSTLLETGGDFSVATDGCVADDAPGTSHTFSDRPPAGDALFVVGRAVREEGPTTYQALTASQIGGRDEEIGAASASCP